MIASETCERCGITYEAHFDRPRSAARRLRAERDRFPPIIRGSTGQGTGRGVEGPPTTQLPDGGYPLPPRPTSGQTSIGGMVGLLTWPAGGERLEVQPWLRFHTHRVTGGGRPPPVPTERGPSLQRLRTDRVDLMQVHNVSDPKQDLAMHRWRPGWRARRGVMMRKRC